LLRHLRGNTGRGVGHGVPSRHQPREVDPWQDVRSTKPYGFCCVKPRFLIAALITPETAAEALRERLLPVRRVRIEARDRGWDSKVRTREWPCLARGGCNAWRGHPRGEPGWSTHSPNQGRSGKRRSPPHPWGSSTGWRPCSHPRLTSPSVSRVLGPHAPLRAAVAARIGAPDG
jgi:hypothetical protein